jgi:hypothetical protein
VVVARFVKVWFSSFRGETKLFFEFLAGDSSLEDPMELFGVDIERRFFGTTGNEFR